MIAAAAVCLVLICFAKDEAAGGFPRATAYLEDVSADIVQLHNMLLQRR